MTVSKSHSTCSLALYRVATFLVLLCMEIQQQKCQMQINA